MPDEISQPIELYALPSYTGDGCLRVASPRVQRHNCDYYPGGCINAHPNDDTICVDPELIGKPIVDTLTGSVAIYSQEWRHDNNYPPVHCYQGFAQPVIPTLVSQGVAG
jgi:hypothetical protein